MTPFILRQKLEKIVELLEEVNGALAITGDLDISGTLDVAGAASILGVLTLAGGAVTLGADDSATSGFRELRVPNA